jgi:hypothetical protein
MGRKTKNKVGGKHFIFVVNKNTITSLRHTYTSNQVLTTRCSRVEKKRHWTARSKVQKKAQVFYINAKKSSGNYKEYHTSWK